MIEAFRFRSFRRLVARIKRTESSQRSPIHIDIHGLCVIQQQCLNKCVIGRGVLRKPAIYHMPEHQPYFLICQRQRIIAFTVIPIYGITLHFQIAAGQKQAPDSMEIMIQLTEYNLFIY